MEKHSGILDRAEAVLQQALSANPRNAKALLRLGEVRRRKGNLAAALDAYEHLCAMEPDNAAASWLASILRGGNLPSVAPSSRPAAPFLRHKGFLDQPEQKRLVELVSAGPERFRPAEIERKRGKESKVDPNMRNAVVMDFKATREVRYWFADKLRSTMPGALAHFGIEGLDRYGIDMDITAYHAGSHIQPHKDPGPSWRSRHRKLTFVYYFHLEPKRFSGGDLLLYDTNLDLAGIPNDLSACGYSRIEPLQNSLVIFPSNYVHEVTPVECDTQDFMDGRFTVNGWVRRRKRNSAGAPTS